MKKLQLQFKALVTCFLLFLSISTFSQIYLNLSVDMRSQIVSPNGVHVAGTFNSWDPASLLMEDNDRDGIYRISIPATAQTYQYKFLNGNAWGTEEVVIGSCVTGTNRLATVSTSSVTMPTVCFGYCSADCVSTDKRLACVGNSITAGAGVSNPATKSWPVQLNGMLGVGYYCENLGVSGRTMLKTGDSPYWNEPQFSRVFTLQADVVFIKLGTNDSKSWNWSGKSAQFKADYKSMIDSFRSMHSNPEIYMLTPAYAYSTAYAIDENVIKNEMIPIMREVAKEKGVNVIDIQSATMGMSQNFPDGVHPNDEGTRVIAQKIYSIYYSTTKPVVTVNGTNLSVTNMSGAAYQWYLNGNVIAGATSSSYNATANGKYKISVKLNSANDDMVVSNTVTIGGQANVAPAVSISSPANNSNFVVGSSITISANASDADGSVSKVEFFNGTTKLGEDLASPYSYVWSGAAIGTYTITAKATDNSNAVTTSSAITISVKANQAPTVSISSPANNSTITSLPASVTATASDADGTISKVEFYAGSTLIGTAITSPYTISWSPANGNYALTAKAFDNSGATATSSAINVTINVSSVSIPAKIEAENWSNMFGVQTETTSDAGGGLDVGWFDANDWLDYKISVGTAGAYTVDFRVATTADAQIQLLSGTTVLGTLNMPNSGGWQNWQTVSMNVNLSAGSQTIRVLAITNGFNFNWINFSKANAAPSVNITSPANNAVISAVPFSISANASDADGSISKVEFYNGTTLLGTASTSPYSISWSPANGTYTLTAKAFDNAGAVTTSSVINITVTTAAAIPGKIEAENWKSMSGVQTENCGDTGGGLDVGYNDNNDWIDYNVNVAIAGTYTVDFRIASTVSTAQIQLLSGSTVLKTVTLPNTGGWQTWQTVSTSVSLTAGVQTIRFLTVSNGFNFNWINFTKSNSAPTCSITAPTNGSTLSASPLNIKANASDLDGTISKVEFYSGATLIGTSTTSPYAVNYNVANGSYTFTAKAYDNLGAVTTSSSVSVTVNIAQSIPEKIESESWSSQSGVQTETTSDAGGGFNVGWIDANDWMDYYVNVAQSGTYTVQFRIASVTANTQCQLLSGSTVLCTVTMPNTGGAQTWITVTANIPLNAGIQTIRFLAKTNSFNINWMNFTFVSTAKSLPLTVNSSINNKGSVDIYPNPASKENITVNASGFDPGENLNISVISLNGSLVYTEKIAAGFDGQTSWKLRLSSKVPDGIVFIKVQSKSNTIQQKIIIK